MRIRLILAVAAAVALVACADSSTAPSQIRPGARTADDITCKSGYHVATRADGTQFCEVDGGEGMMGGGTPPDSL